MLGSLLQSLQQAAAQLVRALFAATFFVMLIVDRGVSEVSNHISKQLSYYHCA